MYEHADQSWQRQPHFIDDAVADALVKRIADYAAAHSLTEIEVVFHGGEPLLAGPKKLVALATKIRDAVAASTACRFSLQTNGVLLDEPALHALAGAGIDISLSLDGPAAVNDRHRLTKLDQSSYADTERALELLTRHPDTFRGVLAVIDPTTDPEEILRYFADWHVPSLDLLLPDANHTCRPLGRAENPELYARWLTAAFDAWFDRYATMPLRTFDALLGAVCGLPSPTDAFGLGAVNLLTIETDGSYHDLDVLKITYDGASALHLNVANHDIDTAMASAPIARHNRMLTLEGLSATCRSCPEVSVCGGGAVPHRYDVDGFSHPSVYCHELLTLIRHIRHRLQHQLTVDDTSARHLNYDTLLIDMAAFDRARDAEPLLRESLALWRDEVITKWASFTSHPLLGYVAAVVVSKPWLATTPTVSCLLRIADAARAGRPLKALDGTTVTLGAAMVASVADLAARDPERRPFVNRHDPLLRAPFGHPITFLDPTEPVAEAATATTAGALDLIARYDPHLSAEVRLLCSDIQFIVDSDADPGKTVSFSDDAVPGALYVAPTTSRGAISVVDLADSIIHEHRHQKLYILQRRTPLLAADRPLVHSPWREEPRPPSGVLHAVFVFAELLAFWRWIEHGASTGRDQGRAHDEANTISSRLLAGVAVLSTVALTDAGRRLVTALGARTTLW